MNSSSNTFHSRSDSSQGTAPNSSSFVTVSSIHSAHTAQAPTVASTSTTPYSTPLQHHASSASSSSIVLSRASSKMSSNASSYHTNKNKNNRTRSKWLMTMEQLRDELPAMFHDTFRLLYAPPKKKPRHYGLQPPLDVLQVLAWLVFSLFVLGFLVFCLTCMYSWVALPVGAIFLLLSFVWYVSNFYLGVSNARDTRSRISKPFHEGDNEEHQDLNWCRHCEAFVDRSSKHCRLCDKCVDNFDHHCRWLNTCIGRKNYIGFCIFVTDTLLVLGFTVVTKLYLLLSFILENGAYSERASAIFFVIPHYLFLVIQLLMGLLEVAAIIPVLQLWLFHIRLITRKQTTYEFIIEKRRLKEEYENAVMNGDFPPPRKKWQRCILLAFCLCPVLISDSHRWRKFKRYEKQKRLKQQDHWNTINADRGGFHRKGLKSYYQRTRGAHAHGNPKATDMPPSIPYDTETENEELTYRGSQAGELVSTFRVTSHDSLTTLQSEYYEKRSRDRSNTTGARFSRNSINRVAPIDSHLDTINAHPKTVRSQSTRDIVLKKIDTNSESNQGKRFSVPAPIMRGNLVNTSDDEQSTSVKTGTGDRHSIDSRVSSRGEQLSRASTSPKGRKRSASDFTPLSECSSPEFVTKKRGRSGSMFLSKSQHKYRQSSSSPKKTSPRIPLKPSSPQIPAANRNNVVRSQGDDPMRRSAQLPRHATAVGRGRSTSRSSNKDAAEFIHSVNQSRRRASAFASLCIADEFEFDRDVYDSVNSPSNVARSMDKGHGKDGDSDEEKGHRTEQNRHHVKARDREDDQQHNQDVEETRTSESISKVSIHFLEDQKASLEQ